MSQPERFERFPRMKMSTPSASAALAPGVRGKTAGDSPSTLAEAVRAVLQSAPATVIADALNSPEKAVYRYACLPTNASNEHRHLPVALVGALTRATGRLDIVEHLAREVGCVLVPLSAPIAGPAPLLERIATLTREFAEVQSCAAEALDGGITKAERAALERELFDVIRGAEGLRRGLREGAA